MGDNVGDVAGMGADLFGSFGEATCAALLVGAFLPSYLSAVLRVPSLPLRPSLSELVIPSLLRFSFNSID